MNANLAKYGQIISSHPDIRAPDVFIIDTAKGWKLSVIAYPSDEQISWDCIVEIKSIINSPRLMEPSFQPPNTQPGMRRTPPTFQPHSMFTPKTVKGKRGDDPYLSYLPDMTE